MSVAVRSAYYADAGMRSGLAARYFRLFGPVRVVLDVGCGVGGLGVHAPDGVTVHGLDRDEGAVAIASRTEIAQVIDLATERLPFEDGFFDAVLAKDILEHLQDPARLVGEIHRVLRPGGVLIASVVMARPKAVWSDYTHVRGFTRRSARMLLEDSGFVVRSLWPMGGVPGSNRLGLIELVPSLLRIPGFSHLWASSWELLATASPGGAAS